MNPPLPRGLSGRQLMRLVEKHGYQYSRSSGSHVIFTLKLDCKQHICIPDHKELSTGTLSDILSDMAKHLNRSKAEVIDRLFGKH